MNNEWDPAAHIRRMTPHVEELVKSLEPHGITFSPMDGELENVVFTSKTKTVKIAHRCFYRFSGMCKILKPTSNAKKSKAKKHQNEVEWVDVTDKMFICGYMGSMIHKLFNL